MENGNVTQLLTKRTSDTERVLLVSKANQFWSQSIVTVLDSR